MRIRVAGRVRLLLALLSASALLHALLEGGAADALERAVALLIAIKCMHPQFARDPSFVSMFMDEARLTARLRHPNIVPTLDIVAEDGKLLLVMEYVEGASLARVHEAARAAGVSAPAPVACAIVHDLLLGLHEAHRAKDDDGVALGIVHRDVSPQNVLVGVDGLARVLDFGVAKARQKTHPSNDDEIKGKIPYMPPEQLFGEPIDHKADVYAAGVILWETLVGERLFEGSGETALVRRMADAPIVEPSARASGIAPELDAIVLRALARDPRDRWDSALAMAEAIARVVPLPTRTEVAEWVRPFAAPSVIATSEKERRRTASLTDRRRGARAARITIGVAAFALALGLASAAVAHVAKGEAAPRRVAFAPVPSAKPRAAIASATPAPLPAATLPPAPTQDAGTRPTPRAKPSSCRTPYTIDDQGHTHFKAECFE